MMTPQEFRLDWINTIVKLKSHNKDLNKYKIGCIDKQYQYDMEREYNKKSPRR